MGMHGEVHVWQMTEEERLAYIAKHPIVPIENNSGAKFNMISQEQQEQAKKARALKPTLTDRVDKEELNERYISGEMMKDIAENMDFPLWVIDRVIRKERKREPEKWPYRLK